MVYGAIRELGNTQWVWVGLISLGGVYGGPNIANKRIHGSKHKQHLIPLSRRARATPTPHSTPPFARATRSSRQMDSPGIIIMIHSCLQNDWLECDGDG